MKITKKAEDPRFIKKLPSGLKGSCNVCRCEVETDDKDYNDNITGRWHFMEDRAGDRSMNGWQVKCPTEECSNWIWVN